MFDLMLSSSLYSFPFISQEPRIAASGINLACLLNKRRRSNEKTSNANACNGMFFLTEPSYTHIMSKQESEKVRK